MGYPHTTTLNSSDARLTLPQAPEKKMSTIRPIGRWLIRILVSLSSFSTITGSLGLAAEPSGNSSSYQSTPDSQESLLGQLWPLKATVVAGGKLRLVLAPCAPTDLSLFPTTPANELPPRLIKKCKAGWFQDDKTVRWFVNGIPNGSDNIGTIVSNQRPLAVTAVYHAPAQAAQTLPVTVSVEYPPFTSEKNSHTLVSTITVINPPKCEDYRDVSEMTGHMHFTYNFAGADNQGNNLRLNQSAAVSGILTRSSESNGERLVWRGPIHHSASLGDGRTLGKAQLSLKGTGIPDNTSEMVLWMQLSDCTYRAGVTVGIKTEESIRIGFVAIPEQKGSGRVGSVQTGVRPIADGMSGSIEMTVSEQPPPKETDDRYHPGGLGTAFITQGFATEDSAGKADVSWSFGPIK